MESAFSDPSPWQRDLMSRMLSVQVQKVDLLRDQAYSSRTRVIDADGSFEVSTSSQRWDVVADRVPIEATALDTDGVEIQILIHVVDGKVREFEIYRVDGKQASSEFNLDSLTVCVPEEDKNI